MHLLNWHRLEDSLVRACEGEVRAFAAEHAVPPFFACCLEFASLTGHLELSYGMRSDVTAAIEVQARRRPRCCYRSVELDPRHWTFRRCPRRDPDGHWGEAHPLLERHRENLRSDLEPAAAEFYWLRFEYLAESVLERLIGRGAFQCLAQEPEFLAYCASAHETAEELEDRLVKLYPRYNRAIREFVPYPRPDGAPGSACEGERCASRPARRMLLRCTWCQSWLCGRCARRHEHPELWERRPFFVPPAGGAPAPWEASE